MSDFEAPDWITAKHDVSRETWLKISEYLRLLKAWSRKTNLIGPKEWPNIWTRHVDDSLALLPHITTPALIYDMGSGAGFPGLILACALYDRPDTRVVMVESLTKKTAFLSTVRRELSLNAEVIKGRAEDHIASLKPNFVTARAVAPLETLLKLAEPALSKTAIGLFHKGANVNQEISKANESWLYDIKLDNHAPDAYIVKIQNLGRKPS